MNLPKISRIEAGNQLQVSDRQVRRYLKVAAQYIESFKSFVDSDELNGTPLTEHELGILRRVQMVLRKYRNSKNREQQIASELSKEPNE